MTQFKKKLLATILLTCIVSLQNLSAQVSKKHYLPPIFGQASNIQNFKIVLTTLEADSFEVTIKNGDGTYKKTVTISRTSPQEVSPKLNGSFIGFPIVKPSDSEDQSHLLEFLNTVLTGQGFILEADKPFFANYMTTIPAQGEILTSKGTAGVGTLFYTGHQHMSYSTGSDESKSHFTSVMALNDNTEIEFYNSRVAYYGQTNKRFTITLNKGESYIIGNSAVGIKQMYDTTDESFNAYNGTRISSTNDIAVNSGSIHGGYSVSAESGSKDIGFDQIAPAEVAGMEYILVEGNGTEKNAMNEVAIVIATEDETTIQVNGKSNATNTYTLAKEGDYVIIPWEKYSDKTMYLKSDKKIVVYQTLSGNESEVSPGMMFIPRLSSNTTKEVLISGLEIFFEDSENENEGPSLYIVTEENAQVTINETQVPQDSSRAVEGTDYWVSYRLTDLKPYSGRDDDMHVTSTSAMTAAVTFISGVVGGGGYYSGFTEADAQAGVGDIGTTTDSLSCTENITLLVEGGLEYEWSSLEEDHWDMIERVNDSTHIFTADSNYTAGPFIYQVISKEFSASGFHYDTTNLTVVIEECPLATIVSATIYDKNSDGIAETIYVTFDKPLNELVDEITSIDWPKEGGNGITALPGNMEFTDEDKKEIKIYLPDTFGPETGADEKSPPSLEYNGTTILIADKIPPLIFKAIKKPPLYNQYAIKDDDDDITFFPQSDTLFIIPSEPIIIEDEWENLFTISSQTGKEFSIHLKEKPLYTTLDDETSALVLVIDNTQRNTIPMTDDKITFTEGDYVQDAVQNGTVEQYSTISGEDGTREGFGSTFRNPVVGIESGKQFLYTQEIPVYDEDGDLLEETIPGSTTLGDQWIAPLQFQEGVLDPSYKCTDDDIDNEQHSIPSRESFDTECLSSLVIGTYAQEGPYTTTVLVYDHLGQYINTWSQSFGFCGEFENEQRQSQSEIEGYFLNDLVWNLKDRDGRKVGAGVYYWNVSTTFESGVRKNVKKQMGVVRHSDLCE